MSEKSKLSKALLYAPENGFDRLPESERAAMRDYCEAYKKFFASCLPLFRVFVDEANR